MPHRLTLPDHLTTRLCRYDDLTALDLERWRELCAGHPDYQSPLLGPEFTYVLACVRSDVRIALYEQDETLKAVLAIHLRPDGLARPLGAPFSDYSGPVTSPDFSLSLDEMLSAAGIAAYEANNFVDPWQRNVPEEFRDHTNVDTELPSHVIRPDGLSPEAYIEQRRAAHPKRFKNFRRLASQIERDAGKLRLEWGPVDGDRLKQLLAYKSEQFRRSGLIDLTVAPESKRILEAVACSAYSFWVTLWIGDTLVSGHFGIKAGTGFHPWISSFNPAYGAYSPGILLIMKVLEAMPEMGLETYDLSNGHDHYKKYFANASRPTVPVFARGQGLDSWRQFINHRIWSVAGARDQDSLAARLKRRIDQIAVSELRPAHRISAFGYALLAHSRRRSKT